MEALQQQEAPYRKARKPVPGRGTKADTKRPNVTKEKLEKEHFRHFYDWLRTKPAYKFKYIAQITGMIIPREHAEEFRLLYTIIAEESENVLLPHSFAETLDFLLHAEDIRYAFAVMLDTGYAHLSQHTYWNIRDFYLMPKEQLAVVRRSVVNALQAFSESGKVSPEMIASLPPHFRAEHFKNTCRKWFEKHG